MITEKDLRDGLEDFIRAARLHSHACYNSGASAQLEAFRKLGAAEAKLQNLMKNARGEFLTQ